MNKLRLWLIRLLIGKSWDDQIDQLRDTIENKRETYERIAKEKGSGITVKEVSELIFSKSNEVELSRRMFNHFSYTGMLDFRTYLEEYELTFDGEKHEQK